MIEFENIEKKFRYNFWEKDFLALDKVSFEIKTGDLVGFLGANGAGKTTLIKILMDFVRQDSGHVRFSSELGKGPEEVRGNIGYLPERAYLYPHLTGREFLTYIGLLSSIRKDELKSQIEYWGEKLQIRFAFDRNIHGYSKGMQQRLGFASALIHRPKFIVLDEPLSGLDPIGRKEFKNILQELNKSGVTVFFSSHVVSDVEEICNKVIFIEKGKLIYQGSIDELILKNTDDSYQVKYFKQNQLVVEHVREDQKSAFITQLIEEKNDIVGIEKEKPSLEEIIYKIKK